MFAEALGAAICDKPGKLSSCADPYEKTWQAFTLLLPVRNVRVMGDERGFGATIERELTHWTKEEYPSARGGQLGGSTSAAPISAP